MDSILQENEDFKQSSIYKGIKYFESQEWNLAHEQFELATKTQNVELAYFFLQQTSIILDKDIYIQDFGKKKKLLKIINEISLKFNENNNIVIQCAKILIESLISKEDSKTEFQQLFQQFPNYMLPYFYSGNFNFSTENYLNAIEDFNKAIALCPQLPLLLHNKGKCLQLLGRYGEALDCFDQALSLQKNYIFYRAKQEVLVALDKNIEGLALCDFILQLKKNDEEVYDNKGVNFQKLGNFRNAMICYRIFKSSNQYSDSQLDPEQLKQNL